MAVSHVLPVCSQSSTLIPSTIFLAEKFKLVRKLSIDSMLSKRDTIRYGINRNTRRSTQSILAQHFRVNGLLMW